MPYASGDEQHVIDRLRKKNALSLSLVALIDNIVVGHIAFSPVHASDNSQPWFALGPVSVLPKHQGNGIGSQLILEGLAQIEGLGGRGCILTGNPDYYSRFGFELAPHNVPSGKAKEYFMLKCFASFRPCGPMHFDTAFYGDA
jgi:putative acetyltransferase